MSDPATPDLEQPERNGARPRGKPSAPRVYSEEAQLDRLLKMVTEEVKFYAEGQISRIKRLIQIGIALSAEKDLSRLLERIVDEARRFTNADAGTLYSLDRTEKVLRFEILQNETLGIRMGEVSMQKMALPPVPLERDGQPNHANLSSYVALTGEIVNIPDVYETEAFDFKGAKDYDAQTGYRSRSMLALPLKDHKDEIIGVLQLINAHHPDTGEVISFPAESLELVNCLASQAAVALTNARLVQELANFFYAFIKSIATAIDEKSPFTGGHIRRVVALTTLIVRAVNQAQEGPFADIHFTNDEVEELRLAAWMHDVGKITTPEHIIDKRTKLETVFDRIRLIETRFDLIDQTLRLKYLEEKTKLLESGEDDPGKWEELERHHQAARVELQEELEFIRVCNLPSAFIDDVKASRLEAIARKTYPLQGEEHPYLTPDELYNLSIRKGNLTQEERRIIEQHALMSIRILQELPFPKQFSRVPEIAAGHHEKIDGSGYPFGLAAGQLPLQTRIIALADIFEALTAKDRPYKQPLRLSQAIQILNGMKAHHIDPDLFDLFVKSGVYRDYSSRELDASQIDEF